MTITGGGQSVEISQEELMYFVYFVQLNAQPEDLLAMLRELAHEVRFDELYRLWEIYRAKEAAYAKLADFAGARVTRMAGSRADLGAPESLQ